MSLLVAECTFNIINYHEFALKTLIRGLHCKIEAMVKLRHTDSLEVAISDVIEEENFLLTK